VITKKDIYWPMALWFHWEN